METTNLFVYVELTKFVENLTDNIQQAKQYLKSQAGYFNIIPIKYFSDALCPEWQSITEEIKKSGPQYNKEGKLIANAYVHTIENMTQQECSDLAHRIITLQQKVKKEIE
jgi:hypothetical protein